MDGLHIILTLMVGACIGYVTNYIAVKMLFRPHNEVKIGNFKVPFTPGVMPKNKPRIAKACGDAIAGTLLSKGDIGESLSSGLKQIEGIRLYTYIGDKTSEDISTILTEKVIDGIKENKVADIIVDKGVSAIEERLKGGMLAMFITRETIMSFAAPLSGQIEEYVAGEGRSMIYDMIFKNIEDIRGKTAGELAAEINVDLASVIGGVVEKAIAGMDISGMVEKKINEMDIMQFEELVLSVMKKELNAIVRLGALIGLVIGAINILL